MKEKSRTQIKKEAEALQALGEKLTRLSDDQLEHPAIPDALRQAVRDAKAIHSHEARRRQIQFVGRLMREFDSTTVREMIRDIEEGHRDEIALFRQAEAWRDGLIRGENSLLDTISRRFPDTDWTSLIPLIQMAQKNPLTGTGKRASKQLFRALHDLIVSEHHANPNKTERGDE
jgi:ribosome-associated protein